MSDQNQYLLALSARIVAAHAGHNRLESDALPSMIRNVFNTLSSLDPSAQIPAGEASHTHDGHDHEKHDLDGHRLSHAHNGYVHPTYGQTVFGDHLVCMEDGLSMKMLKRHLLTVHGMTPDEDPSTMGPAGKLPDGRGRIRQVALHLGAGKRPWPEAGRPALQGTSQEAPDIDWLRHRVHGSDGRTRAPPVPDGPFNRAFCLARRRDEPDWRPAWTSSSRSAASGPPVSQ